VNAKGVTEDCLVFHDGELNVNVIPLESFKFLPRVGECLYLPGSGDKESNLYRIDKITHYYRVVKEQPVDRAEAALLNITAEASRVHPKGS